MERVPLGSRVNSLGINRAVCAQGCKSRAVLIDRDPRMKYIGWDDKRKRRVELTQDLVIKYGLKPMTTFFYLIARLNTDMKGNVIGNDFVIEYLQLSENINNDFSDDVQEHPNFKSLSMNLVSKKAGERDFSYIDVKASDYEVSPEIQEKVDALRNDPAKLDAMWSLIDMSTSMKPEEYEKLLLEEANAGGEKPQVGARQTQAQLEARVQQQISGQASDAGFSEGDSFGETLNDDDFSDM